MIVDHIYRRIQPFVRFRDTVQSISFGEFIEQAPHNPARFRQGFWAVNCSLDQFPAMTLASIVAQHDLHLTCAFLTSDHAIVDQYRHLNFRYFPYFVAEGIAQIKTADLLENPNIEFVSRKNCLTFVNRFARFHRVYAFYRLSQQSNLGDVRVSFTALETTVPDDTGYLRPVHLSLSQLLERSRLHGYHSEDFEAWLTQEYPQWPRQIESLSNYDNKYDNWVCCEAFSESYANIVTETYVEDFLPTEKTVKPLLAGCLIMPTASRGFMQKLERMGFDLSFEGIDYGRYDQNLTWIQRVDAVIELANEIYPNIADLWHANLQRLQHNRHLFFSRDLEQHVLADVQDVFELS